MAVRALTGSIYRYPSWRRRSFSASLSDRSGDRSGARWGSDAMIAATLLGDPKVGLADLVAGHFANHFGNPTALDGPANSNR